MSYTNFFICKEHKFLGNIFSNALKDLKRFYGKFVRFLRVAVFLQNAFKINDEFDECFDDDLLDFCKK